MTAEEATFCNLVNAFVSSQIYSCWPLQRQVGEHYSLKLHRLGDPDGKDKFFTVFANDLQASVKSGKLPEGLRKTLEHECTPCTPSSAWR
jgi:hypothetical protein